MNKTAIIGSSILVIMTSFLVLAFITKDEVIRQLLASFGIITGVYTSNHFSKLNEQ